MAVFLDLVNLNEGNSDYPWPPRLSIVPASYHTDADGTIFLSADACSMGELEEQLALMRKDLAAIERKARSEFDRARKAHEKRRLARQS